MNIKYGRIICKLSHLTQGKLDGQASHPKWPIKCKTVSVIWISDGNSSESRKTAKHNYANITLLTSHILEHTETETIYYICPHLSPLLFFLLYFWAKKEWIQNCFCQKRETIDPIIALSRLLVRQVVGNHNIIQVSWIIP